MMKVALPTALLVTMLLLFGCSDPETDSINETIEENNEKISENAEANSAIQTVHSLDDAKAQLAQDWAVQEPTDIPDGYSLLDYYVYDKDLIEIRYGRSDNQNELYYRTSRRHGDISGNSHPYTNVETISSETIDQIQVRGSDDLWMVATWNKDDIAYSISCEKGLSQDALTAMIDSIQ